MLTAQALKEVRSATGMGLHDCKAALIAHSGNVAGAIEHLACLGQAVVRRGANAVRPCGCRVRS